MLSIWTSLNFYHLGKELTTVKIEQDGKHAGKKHKLFTNSHTPFPNFFYNVPDSGLICTNISLFFSYFCFIGCGRIVLRAHFLSFHYSVLLLFLIK